MGVRKGLKVEKNVVLPDYYDDDYDCIKVLKVSKLLFFMTSFSTVVTTEPAEG